MAAACPVTGRGRLRERRTAGPQLPAAGGRQPGQSAQAYGGKVLLVVNTASKCGFTPQFEALEALHAKYKAQGFAVLGFPSGDFIGAGIRRREADPGVLHADLRRQVPDVREGARKSASRRRRCTGELAARRGESPKWNFHKYLIGRDGQLIASYGSKTRPDDAAVVAAIERALAAPPRRPGGALRLRLSICKCPYSLIPCAQASTARI